MARGESRPALRTRERDKGAAHAVKGPRQVWLQVLIPLLLLGSGLSCRGPIAAQPLAVAIVDPTGGAPALARTMPTEPVSAAPTGTMAASPLLPPGRWLPRRLPPARQALPPRPRPRPHRRPRHRRRPRQLPRPVPRRRPAILPRRRRPPAPQPHQLQRQRRDLPPTDGSGWRECPS